MSRPRGQFGPKQEEQTAHAILIYNNDAKQLTPIALSFDEAPRFSPNEAYLDNDDNDLM